MRELHICMPALIYNYIRILTYTRIQVLARIKAHQKPTNMLTCIRRHAHAVMHTQLGMRNQACTHL